MIDCSGTIPDEKIEEQVTFLQNKTSYDASLATANQSVSLQTMKEAGNIFLYMSFCFKQPSGLELLTNLVIGNDQKKQMIDEAVSKVHESHYKAVLANMSKLEEENKLHNWYHGYSDRKSTRLNSSHSSVSRMPSSA